MLAERHCKPCRKGDPALEPGAAAALLAQLDGWRLEGASLAKDYEGFASYAAGLAFTNAVAALAEAEGHHPDILLGWRRVSLRWTTHAVGGLTENDFICAARTDGLRR